jgi:hypothetical protein
MLSGMDEELGAVLAVLVARTGAHAARVVDARSGGVLAQVGAISAEDVRALVALARDAVPVTGDDLVLPTSDGVHVLRSFAGAFVHLRAGAGRGVVVARQELASPALRQAVDRAVNAAVLDPGTVPVPQVPRPRHARSDDRIQPPQVLPARTPPDRPEPRRAGPAPDGRQPALAAIGPAVRRTRGTGPLAVRAMAADAVAPVTLPRRAVAGPVARPHLAIARPLALPAVLKQEWAGDVATMGRLLDGLRRLN